MRSKMKSTSNGKDKNKIKKAKILVIDDDPSLLEMIQDVLLERNFKVITANNGESAIKKTREFMPDLILLDMKLPGIDGWEVCKTLKKEGRTAAIPIIIFTGVMTEVKHEIKSLAFGADDYITKPCNIEVLLVRINILLRRTEEIKILKEMVALYQVSAAMSALMETPRLLELIFKLASEVVGADGGSITLFDPLSQELVVKVAKGSAKEEILGERIKFGERICGYAAKEKMSVVIKGPLKDDPRFKHLKEYNGIKSGMSIPMIIKDKIIGTINLKRIKRDDKFTDRDVQLISIFAQQAAFAIENTSLYEQAKNYSKGLEQKVKELETFTDIAVGRELKMAEMAKEIKRLKKEIEKLRS